MSWKLSTKAYLAAACLLGLASNVLAASFSVGIAPSRFELRAQPGQVLRDNIAIMNASDERSGYVFRTADWEVTESQGLEYTENELAPGSCRPWVRLERRELAVAARGQKRYRFEVHVPEDAEPGLCKFAILVEPAEAATAMVGEDDQIRFPVVGRYAVIVYVTVGDARAEVEFGGLGRHQMGQLILPTLKLSNHGTTYDRVFGRITATDAAGQRHVLIASDFPVMPDANAEIMLYPEMIDNGRVDHIDMQYPLQLKGRFEVGGESFSVEQSFD